MSGMWYGVGVKHNLIKNYGKVDLQRGRIIRPQFRCSCGQWNRVAKNSTDIEHQQMHRDFELHCAQVGHAINSKKR